MDWKEIHKTGPCLGSFVYLFHWRLRGFLVHSGIRIVECTKFHFIRTINLTSQLLPEGINRPYFISYAAAILRCSYKYGLVASLPETETIFFPALNSIEHVWNTLGRRRHQERCKRWLFLTWRSHLCGVSLQQWEEGEKQF